MEPLDYEKAGVRYDMLDAFKRACQRRDGNGEDGNGDAARIELGMATGTQIELN
jgi:hypothetical protein